MLASLVKKHFSSYKNYETEIICSSIQFLLRSINLKVLKQQLDFAESRNIIDFKRELRETGYYHTNLKMWLYYCIKNNLKPKKAKRLMVDFNIPLGDFKVLQVYMKNRHLYPVNTEYNAHTLSKIRSVFSKVLERNKVYAYRMAYYKLRFLTYKNGIDLEDMVGELLMKALDSMLMKYPKIESTLHLENTCRTAIHNNGINMLYYYNNKARSNLVESTIDSAYQFQSRLISTSHLSNDIKDSVFEDYLTLGETTENAEQFEENLDNELTVTKLMRLYKGKDRRFLKLLSGVHHKRFSRFLDKPNDEFYDKVKTETYIKKCCVFLNMSEYRAYNLINNVREQIGDHYATH